jgi:5-oxoprolinase (ATP-hydrolysing)
VRGLEFGVPIKVGILSECRAFAPYGMNGGGEGQRGENWWVKKGGRVVNLGGKNTALMRAGDRIVINSPRGGGWGKKGDGNDEKILDKVKKVFTSVANGTVDMIQSMGESA